MRQRHFYILAFLTLIPVVPAIVLFGASTTANGRLVAVACVAFWAGVILPGAAWMKGKSRKVILGAIAFPLTATLLLIALVYLRTPDGRPLPGGAMGQVYLNGGSYRRASLANLVPEVDQFNLGFALLPHLGLALDEREQGRVRGLFQSVYREMDASEEFYCLGSNMNFAYREFLPGKFDVGHAYVYIPPAAQEPSTVKRPVILFLHGSLGNFKGYMWVLKKLADRQGYAIIAPSFGLGNWSRPGGAEAVERARRWIANQPGLDSENVYLACLSNGGLGLMRAAIERPAEYRGLISISGYLKLDEVRSAEFVRGWAGRPALILQGGKDDRVQEVNVRRAVDEMALRGIRTTYRVWPNEDHFLFFSAQEEVIEEIGGWLSQQPANR